MGCVLGCNWLVCSRLAFQETNATVHARGLAPSLAPKLRDEPHATFVRALFVACWAYRSKTRISRAAFGFWARLTAAIDSFWQKVLNGRECDGTNNFKGRTVLAYGDGKWGVGRAPHKRILDSAIRVFGRECVIMTKEFNTTKTHHHCGDEQQDVVDKEKNYKRGGHACATERSLKRCNRTSCSSWQDRDVNVRLTDEVRRTKGNGGGH